MLHIITGGSGSGKSAYAEECIVRYHRDGGEKESALYYIATMEPFGEETLRKIERHRKMRSDKGFRTIECYRNLSEAAEQIARESERADVLLECMSNLTANELYAIGAEETVVDSILEGIRKLRQVCDHVVIVTNEVCLECTDDSKEMQLYKKVLSRIGREMVQMADRVTEVEYGIAIERKIASEPERKSEVKSGMRMVIGGGFQGKTKWAQEHYGVTQWADGRECPFEEIYHCEGIHHFHEYIRRAMMQEENDSNHGKTLTDVRVLPEALSQKNPNIVIVTDEIGCGLVPVDAFMRKYREETGRICTELASRANEVVRVVLGIGTVIKSAEATKR